MNTSQARMQRIATIVAGILASPADVPWRLAGGDRTALIVASAVRTNSEIERAEDTRLQGAAQRYADEGR